MAQRTVTIASSVGLHARPAALFVRGGLRHRPRRRDRPPRRGRRRRDEHPRRHGARRHARRGGRAHRRGRRRRRGPRGPGRPALPRPRRGGSAVTATETRQGIGVSPGSAYGPVVQVAPPVRPPDDEPAVDDHEAALVDVRAAFESVAVALEGRARRADDTAQQILEATALMARDKGLVEAAGRQLAAGRGRATAISNAVEEYCVQFEALGGYFAERVTDLRDVGSRAVAAVLGVPAPGVPELSEPSVVVAQDLAPAETATLDRSLVVGIVTESGGRTSHTAILAAQLGIPAVVQLAGATGIPAGTPVALDGDTGQVTIAPDIALVEAQRVRREKRATALAAASGPGVDPRRPPRGAARQHRRGARRRGGRGPRPRGCRPVPHRVRVPVGRQGTHGAGAGGDLPQGPSALRHPARGRPHAGCRRRQAAGLRRPRARAEPGARAGAGCACRPSGPSCSTRSSRPSPSPPGTPVPTCG